MILESPYRLLVEPLLQYIDLVDAQRQPNEIITVIVPEFVPKRRWQTLLHTTTALTLRLALRSKPGIIVTDAMLQAARQRHLEGMDVVVVSLDTHGSVETEALLAGLEMTPRLQAGYRGAAMGEIDVDAVFARSPQLALVDELVQANPVGGRHPKRYQDVEELLAAGVDVYATLNIGQLENLRDVAAQITGVPTLETVPDRLLEEAFEVQVVDLSGAPTATTARGQGSYSRADRAFCAQVLSPGQPHRAARNHAAPNSRSSRRSNASRYGYARHSGSLAN